MIPVHIALVDQTGNIDNATLNEVAGALNEQIQADFAPIWHVPATVGVYTTPPPATWQIVIQTKLSEPGALGYHTEDTHHQPVSYVDDDGEWPVTVSHEALEMLADPFGYGMHAARLPQDTEGSYAKFGLKHPSSRVHYLVEVADPCEATAYEVGGVKLSDFLLPSWYRTTPTTSVFSRAGGCTGPRQVADGGYVSFCNDAGEWFQVFNDKGSLSAQDLGKFSREQFASLREFTDTKAREYRAG